MDQSKHGGARPGAGRKSAEQAAWTAFLVDTIVQAAVIQERAVCALHNLTHDPTSGELRQRAIERVKRQFEVEFGAA